MTLYNFHSHTQFCDGRASMDEMAAAAARAGMKIWGFTPHSPVCVESPCNMNRERMPDYLTEAERLKETYDGSMRILTSLEIDYISPDFGPHIDYFQNLPLDYRLGSVHFVPNRDGVPVDIDGRYERFASNLHDAFSDDLRYVVEKYFEQVSGMIERGGFDILGHLDKVATNALIADPSLENEHWYEALITDIIENAVSRGIKIEINTKSYLDKGWFFPSERFWPILFDSLHRHNGKSPQENLHTQILVNSDAHYPDRVNLGRPEALKKLENIFLK